MKVKFDDIELALEFASSDIYGEHLAHLCRTTGHIYYESDFADEVLPSDISDTDKYVILPCKRDLDLGRRLALDFTELRLGDDYDDVYQIFRSKGAYSKFKSLLEKRNALDDWYEYEQKQQKSRLLEWCKANDVDIEI